MPFVARLACSCEVHYDALVDADVIFVVELQELLPGELCAVVHDNGVRYSKAMDGIKEEQHGLLGLDHGDRLSFDLFCKLVYGDKWVKPPGAFLRGPTRSSP